VTCFSASRWKHSHASPGSEIRRRGALEQMDTVYSLCTLQATSCLLSRTYFVIFDSYPSVNLNSSPPKPLLEVAGQPYQKTRVEKGPSRFPSNDLFSRGDGKHSTSLLRRRNSSISAYSALHTCIYRAHYTYLSITPPVRPVAITLASEYSAVCTRYPCAHSQQKSSCPANCVQELLRRS
jgi:hypothetical protein